MQDEAGSEYDNLKKGRAGDILTSALALKKYSEEQLKPGLSFCSFNLCEIRGI